MKQEDNNIAYRIKESVKAVDPEAQVTVFGSRARGDAKQDSDWDILILVNYPVTMEVENAFRDILFDLEIDSGEVFSTFIYNRRIWDTRHKITPLYRNIRREGIRL